MSWLSLSESALLRRQWQSSQTIQQMRVSGVYRSLRGSHSSEQRLKASLTRHSCSRVYTIFKPVYTYDVAYFYFQSSVICGGSLVSGPTGVFLEVV